MDTQQAISADSHVDLPWFPEDIFKEAAPQALRDRVPTIVDTPDGRQWTIRAVHGWVVRKASQAARAKTTSG